MLTITTDHKWKNFVSFYDLPKKFQKEIQESISSPDDTYFIYKKYWYSLDDFLPIKNNPELANWDGYRSDSFFSGIVIKLSGDGEQYQVGTYFS